MLVSYDKNCFFKVVWNSHVSPDSYRGTVFLGQPSCKAERSPFGRWPLVRNVNSFPLYICFDLFNKKACSLAMNNLKHWTNVWFMLVSSFFHIFAIRELQICGIYWELFFIISLLFFLFLRVKTRKIMSSKRHKILDKIGIKWLVKNKMDAIITDFRILSQPKYIKRFFCYGLTMGTWGTNCSLLI